MCFSHFDIDTYMLVKQKPGLDNGQRAGFLRNKAIQHVANKVWFKTSKTTKGGCDAVAYQRLFKPLSDVSLALVLNGVCRFIYFSLLSDLWDSSSALLMSGPPAPTSLSNSMLLNISQSSWNS